MWHSSTRFALAIHQKEVSRGTNWRTRQEVYRSTAGGAGVAYRRASEAAAAQQVTARHEARTPTSGVSRG
jgi:hypothetical protein